MSIDCFAGVDDWTVQILVHQLETRLEWAEKADKKTKETVQSVVDVNKNLTKELMAIRLANEEMERCRADQVTSFDWLRRWH